MQLQFIFETAGIAIAYDHSNAWLYVDWKGEHTQESSREACLLLLESLRAWPCRKILNDNSNITSTNVELSEWGTWWLGEMLEAGLKSIAWVYPRHFAARQATELAVQLIQQPTIATFDDVASAYLWLQNQR
jgi:hypothetical protein